MMADGESEEFAFWLQIDELNRANAERASPTPRELNASAKFSTSEIEDPHARQHLNKIDQSIFKKVLAATFRRGFVSRAPVKPASAPGVANGDLLQLSVIPPPFLNNSPRKNIVLNHELAKKAMDGIDPPVPQKALLLSIARECEQPKDDHDHQQLLLLHPEQFPPSCRSCNGGNELPKLETSSSKTPLQLRVDGLIMELDALLSSRKRRSTTADQPALLESEESKLAAVALFYEQQLQMDGAMAEMQAEILTRKHQQLWQDELLARRIEMEDLKMSSNESDLSTSSDYEYQVHDLFFAEARDDRGYVGIGSVMKDAEGLLVFENRECLGIEVSHHFAQYTALINGLAYARSAGVNHINAHGNPAFIYWEVQGLAEVWTPEQLELMDALQEQVKELVSFNMECVSRAENKEAIDLAKYATALHMGAVNQIKDNVPLKGKSPLKEDESRKQCFICLEKIFASDVVSQKACDHHFCFNCLSQHVENETLASKVPVRCPQFFVCASHMGLYECQRLLSPKIFDVYARRLTEATISESEKVYCPFPDCSAMMWRNDEKKTTTRSRSSSKSPPERLPIGGAECMECHRMFCVECLVPWHVSLTCEQYQRLPPGERDTEDIKLFQLAKDQNWRRCKQCRRMIILSHGCFHMTCRCGYEFCYTCETEYQKKKKVCRCPLYPVDPQLWMRR